MNKSLKIVILAVVFAIVVLGAVLVINGDALKFDEQILKTGGKQITPPVKISTKENITVVPTMRDAITGDSSWCGTFQLVWNDMKNEVVKQDVVFTPQEEMATNLNLEEFNETMVSEEYYYKTYGLKTLELKEKIEKGIKEKFDQESDILDDIDWSEDALNNPEAPTVKEYIFYTMLYKKFEFLKAFDKLEQGSFGEKYNNVKYFGINENTNDMVRNQIDVLYYNSEDDFALLLNTKTDDEVIFCKNPKGNNFKEIYEAMNKEKQEYEGSRNFEDIDTFKAPNLEFNIKRNYEELINKPFNTADPMYPIGIISKAIQTIKLTLDEKGGEIKSEAVIEIKGENAIVISEEKNPRNFNVDDTFVLFLKQKNKTMPYFATRVEDITKYQ